MLTIKNYVRVKTLEEAFELNKLKTNWIIGGMMWLRMSDRNVNTAIDLCDLGLDKIEENDDEFSIGAMVTLRQLEKHEGLNSYSNGIIRDAVKDIVGVQFRNGATIGGSIWGRFGFSDVLTAFLCMDSYVELHQGGTIPLEEFVSMPVDNDILVRVILKKTPGTFVYSTMRNTKTDFPVIACGLSCMNSTLRATIGARPGRAVLIKDCSSIDDLIASINSDVKFESNLRGSAEYRKHLAVGLTQRNYDTLKKLQ